MSDVKRESWDITKYMIFLWMGVVLGTPLGMAITHWKYTMPYVERIIKLNEQTIDVYREYGFRVNDSTIKGRK